jgi:hypothetical protein
MQISSTAIRKTWEQEEALCIKTDTAPHLAQFRVIDTSHEHHAARVISTYSDEQRVFIRCAASLALIEHFHLDDHDAEERLAKYRLSHPAANYAG